jgi:hypothetical protein
LPHNVVVVALDGGVGQGVFLPVHPLLVVLVLVPLDVDFLLFNHPLLAITAKCLIFHADHVPASCKMMKDEAESERERNSLTARGPNANCNSDHEAAQTHVRLIGPCSSARSLSSLSLCNNYHHVCVCLDSREREREWERERERERERESVCLSALNSSISAAPAVEAAAVRPSSGPGFPPPSDRTASEAAPSPATNQITSLADPPPPRATPRLEERELRAPQMKIELHHERKKKGTS